MDICLQRARAQETNVMALELIVGAIVVLAFIGILMKRKKKAVPIILKLAELSEEPKVSSVVEPVPTLRGRRGPRQGCLQAARRAEVADVLALLSQSPATWPEIAAATGQTVGATKTMLSKLLKAGTIRVVGTKKSTVTGYFISIYGIPSASTEKTQAAAATGSEHGQEE
jgi:hypothetical protein